MGLLIMPWGELIEGYPFVVTADELVNSAKQRPRQHQPGWPNPGIGNFVKTSKSRRKLDTPGERARETHMLAVMPNAKI